MRDRSGKEKLHGAGCLPFANSKELASDRDKPIRSPVETSSKSISSIKIEIKLDY